MKPTNYKGIDYAGAGATTNRDAKTGIRYGVISQHTLSPESADDIFTQGDDLTYAGYMEEAKGKLRAALSDYFSEHIYGSEKQSRLDRETEYAFDAVSESISEQYEPDSPQMRYEREGYVIQTCLQSDFFVIKSPFFTFAQYCSPCVPGACNLDSPLELEAPRLNKGENPEDYDANKCYCLGHDWFDDGKAPYTVFSVETGQEVKPPQEELGL